jgi:3D (Asp-Asp-Asp) domain-containing protein
MRNCSQKVSSVLALVAITGIAMAGKQGSETTKVETKVVTKTLESGIHYQFSRSVGAGRLVKAQEGKDGFVKRTYRVTYRDGKAVKELIKEETSAPKPTLMLMGRAGFTPSRGSFMRRKVLKMSATGYDPSPATIGPGATGRTRTGRRATYGIVAVDPRVIPLNSLVYVEGYGFAIAADTGGAIKGNKIDLCFDSRSKALRFGRKSVRVHVLK